MTEFTRPIPEYGDLMTREEWLTAVEHGFFIDYDGFGNPSNGTHVSDQYIYPSQADQLPEDATHVMWYNK